MKKDLDRPELSNYEYLKLILDASKRELDETKLTVAQREQLQPLVNRFDAILEEYAYYKSFFEEGK